jgi:hypothetical protein
MDILDTQVQSGDMQGRPQTFFQGTKIYLINMSNKTTKKILFFSKKSENILFLAAKGVGEKSLSFQITTVN